MREVVGIKYSPCFGLNPTSQQLHTLVCFNVEISLKATVNIQLADPIFPLVINDEWLFVMSLAAGAIFHDSY